MKVNPEDFSKLVNKAMQHTELSAIRPVIEKELLHYDILYCLDQTRLLDDLVFQGGTSLRLCYGANRFSEDLDFVGGVNFSSAQLETIKTHLEEYIGQRYRLEVTVKEPAALKTEKYYSELRINKWQIAITTSPERRDIAKQRIMSIADIVNSKGFYDEMKRFLPTNVYERTLGQQKFKSYLIDTLTDLLNKLYNTLYQGNRAEREFVL